MKKLLTLFLCVATAWASSAQCHLDYSAYQLVLNEQFDTYSGQTSQLLGPSSIWKATPDDIYGGWGIEYFDPGQVSLIPDGSGGYRLRLSAQKLPGAVTLPNGRNVWYKSGCLTLKDKPAGNFDPISPACAADYPNSKQRGFAYGMFEVRCKTPAGDPNFWDTWPAFWLISIGAELDIIDDISANPGKFWQGGMNDWTKLPWQPNNPDWVQVPYCATCPEYDINTYYYPGNIISTNWGVSYQAINNATPIGCGMVATAPLENLSSDFHTFTAVWTPEKITFFFDGRETYTIPASKAHLSAECPLNIIADLQMHSSAKELNNPEPFTMDIDYIKVYKPKGYPHITEKDYANTPFKNSEGWINHMPLDQNNWQMLINSEYGSLAINPDNTNEFFYKGTDNRMYRIRNNNGSFTNEWISYGVNNSGNTIGGSLAFNTLWGIIVFRGTDNYLHFLNYWNNGTWHDNVFGTTTDYLVSTDPGSIVCAGDGDIVFKAPDNRLHRVVYNGTASTNTILGNYGASSNYVKGDIQVGSTVDALYYKGVDNRIQAIWRDPSTNIRYCVYIDDYWSTTNYMVSTQPGSLALNENGGNNELYYIGQDDEIHHFYWNVDWLHEWLPYTYNVGVGYPNADKARGNIAWDNVNHRVVYAGYDGRIQFFENGPAWYHGWINDYWNTLEYNHYTDVQVGSPNIQLANAVNGAIYYNDDDKVFRYFIWEGCEYAIDHCDPINTKDLNRIAQHGVTGGTPAAQITYVPAFPNPSSDGIFHLTYSGAGTVTVTDLQGRVVLQRPASEMNNLLDLSAESNGMYLLEIKTETGIQRQKLVLKK